MVASDTARELMDVLLRRSEVVESVFAAPRDKPSLVDEVTVSRSTVDRALRELEELGLVEAGPDGFTPTLVAELVVREYNDFEESVAAVAAQQVDSKRFWNTTQERREALRLVAQRFAFLDCVATTPRDKRTLVEILDYSRATVDRTTRDLENAGLIHWTTEGYTPTAVGRHAAEQYRTAVETITDIVAAQDILRELPTHVTIPSVLLINADIERADEAAPYRLLGGLRERIETADRLRLLLPMLVTPRLLDCCHRRTVQDEMPLELILDPALVETLQTEFPGPLSEMATAGAFTALVADTPSFGLLLADAGTETTVSIIAYREHRAIYGVIHNDTDAAVQWAEERYERARTNATERTDDLRDIAPAEMGSVGLSTIANPERVAREAEGFVQLTPDYFAQREAAPPATGWRTGFDLVDVHAGYAIDREYECEADGTRHNLIDELVDRLHEGTDLAVIGSPGSGKSTVCKAVACQWYEQGNGAVFYRESGTGTTFRSRTILGAHLRAAATEGHALVVVEDAVRADANAIFRLLKAFRGNASVTFLLDARESEWQNPTAFPADAGLDAYRTEAIETVTMPPLDEPECERFVRHAEATVGRDIDTTAAQLLRGIKTETADIQGESAGTPNELLLLLHRLAVYIDPLAGYDAQTPTTLVEDIQQTYEDLRDAGEFVLDVGVLVNLLNAAGIGVSPDLVSTLADDGDEFEAVRDALSLLEGRIIFEREGDAPAIGTSYRAVHEAWSELFLDHLSDAESDSAARRRFGQCVTALLSLADDPARRERITSAFAGDAPVLERVVATPAEWADATAERVFHLGLKRPRLASLFGTAEQSHITLPAAGSPALEPRCAEWRGRMYFERGDHTQANRELERVSDLVADDDAICPDQKTELTAQSDKYRGAVAYKRGEFAAAEEFYAHALDSYRALDDRLGEADCHNNLGAIAHERSNLDRAEACYEQSLDTYREFGAARKKRANTLNNLGWTAAIRGDLDRAEEYLERGLDSYRELDDHLQRVNALLNLGEVTRWRGDLDRAEEYHKHGLEIARNTGYQLGEARSLIGLGLVALDRGDLDRAEDYVQRGLDTCREIEDQWGEAMGLRCRGAIAHERDALEAAAEDFTDALVCCRETGYRHVEATTLTELGDLAWTQDDLPHARERFAEAAELHRDIGAIRDAIDTLTRLSEVCEAADDIAAAIDHCETAQQLAHETNFDLEDECVALEKRYERLGAQTE